VSVDRAKVLEAAQKQLGKGNYDKAIAELRKIVKSEPDDVRTWLKIGDLYTRKGARSQAIDTYLHVANTYGDQGFFLKAVAVYKQILKLDPTRLDVQVSLGEMYEMLHLVSDALSTYEHVAAAYARAGDIDKALDTLQKMTGLDPENIPVRIKYAEALSKAGRTKEAADEFEQGAGLLEAQGRIDDYIKVAERLLYHRADDVETARKLANLYLERDDPKRALSKLQLCFKADPKDIQTLTLLAEAFNQLGQLPKTISVYKEVARIHHEASRAEERATTLRRILELDPGDREARQALAQYAGGGGGGSVRRDIQPPASALIQPSQSRQAPEPEPEPEIIEEVEDVELLEVAPEEEEILLVDDDDDAPDMEIVEVDEMEIEEIEAPPPEDGAVSADVQREAQIARLLTECEVFMRYGLKPKVIETLEAILEIDPSHVEAHEKLKDVYLQDGQVERAIAQLLSLADVLSEEHSAAAVLYLRQILDIDPDHPEARARLEAAGASMPPPQASASAALDATADELAPPMTAPADDDEDEVFFLDDDADDEMTDAGEPLAPVVEHTVEQPPPMATVAEARTGPSTATDGEPYPDDTDLPPGVPPVTPDLDAEPMPELEPEPMRHAVIPPPSSELRAPEPEVLPEPLPGPPRSSAPPGVDPLAPMSPEEFEEVPLRPSTPGAARAEASQRLSMPPGEVEETLDEADFFIAQGLLEEARAILQDALTNHPGHPLIGEKIREIDLGLQQRAAAHQARISQEIPVDQSFELAEKLAEEIEEVEDTQAGSDVLDVEQVFAQFKKGVEAQVGAEDTETHFDLGIAYKEMGLLDDAIAEFKLCLSNGNRLCIAQTMIGLCHIEKGEIAEAISHFKKGLYAEQKTEREELGLYFELGHAYELLHDPKEALYYYQKVQKRDPTFRDIGSRIDALTRPQPPQNPGALELAQDDIDAAFDDLMGED